MSLNRRCHETRARRAASVVLSLRRHDLYVRLTLKSMCLSLSVFLSEEGERLDFSLTNLISLSRTDFRLYAIL
jgi:hypothetical protein